MRKVAVVLFDDIEVLDFAGPFEVFSVCGLRTSTMPPFQVFTVAERATISARNKLMITPTYQFQNCPQADIVIVPGGGGYYVDGTPYGSRKEMDNGVMLDWIKEQNKKAELLLSVCTGSLILAKAGLLENLSATTHKGAVKQMQEVAPNTKLFPEERWVDNGRITLSAGISAGIDMSLYVISKLLGKKAADETANYMQYDYWK
jgi:transcriptional regulator GlxA family with amidase domain